MGGRLLWDQRSVENAPGYVRAHGGVLMSMWCADYFDKLARCREMGDAMATAIEERWSGPDGCDCRCCAAAKKWRADA